MTDHLQQVREKLHTLRGKDLAATAQRVGASYDTILRIRDGTTSAPSYSLVMALERALKRVKDAMAQGRPMPMALRENRVWGAKEKLFERVLPKISEAKLAELLQSAHVVDGIVKGLRQPDWPASGWQALHQLALRLCGLCAAGAGVAAAGRRAG